MVLSKAHFTKSRGSDGADVLQTLLGPMHRDEFLESYICVWRVAMVMNKMYAGYVYKPVV